MAKKEIVETTITEKEGSKFGWGVLGFFFPLVGLILFLVWLKDKKKAAKAAGIGALIGFILNVIVTVLAFTGVISIFTLAGEPVIDVKTNTKAVEKKKENKEKNKEEENKKEESKKEENKNYNSKNENKYDNYLNGLKTRSTADPVRVRTLGSDSISFILGTDNKLYVANMGDTDIPGAMGSGGAWKGLYTNIDGVVAIFNSQHSPMEGGSLPGLLVLKEDGKIYIMRDPSNGEYSLEQLNYSNIVSTYESISPNGTTYVVDIDGNTYEIK